MTLNRTRAWAIGLTLCVAPACTSGDSGLGPGPSSCDAAQLVNLAPGQAVAIDGAATRSICVGAASGHEEFVLVGMNRTEGGSITLTASSENAVIAAGPPAAPEVEGRIAARSTPSAMGGALDLDGPRPDYRFHESLRQREREELPTPDGRIGDLAIPTGPAIPATAPAPGDLISLNAQPESACTEPIPIVGRVRAVSDDAVVVADIDNPSGGFSTADYQHFAATFDTLIVPAVEEYFGTPSDIDGNGRTLLLFTKEVNAIAPSESDAFTAGFFFARDLFPTSGSNSCGTSNESEMLYLLVPDGSGEFGSRRSYDFVEQFTLGTVAHEYQHLINASVRLFESGGPFPQETWLNEGLSHIAEEAVFFRASGLGPRQNLGAATIGTSQSRVDAFNFYQINNFLRLVGQFLHQSETTSLFDSEVTLASRGASWSFLRYAADRRAGDEAEFFRSLVAAPTTAFQGLALGVGGAGTLFDWLADWGVALYADDRIQDVAARHRDRSWNHPELWTAVQDPPFSPYPIQTRSIGDGISSTQTLVSGGPVYLRFGVESGEIGRISLTSGGSAPPPSFRATLLRTR